MQSFSPGETLASLQAMIIYTIMRLMSAGISYFVANRDMLKTNRVGILLPRLRTEANERELTEYGRLSHLTSSTSPPVPLARRMCASAAQPGQNGFLRRREDGS